MPPLLDKYYNDTLKNSPLAYYRMREGTGTTMIDASPNPLNGTYSGTGITWINAQGHATSSTGFAVASGKNVPLFNSYVSTWDYTVDPIYTAVTPTTPIFDGAAGRATATLTGINTSAASKVTLGMWFKWDGNLAGANGTFEALANFGGATGILIGFLKNGAADYRFGVSSRNAGDLWGIGNADTLALITRDVYHYLVVVITNNALQSVDLYLDGVLLTDTQQIGTTTNTESVTTAFAIGYDGTASFFQGGIAEVAVYNGAPFNATAVKNRYYQGAYGVEQNDLISTPGLEAQVDIGSAQAITLNDKTSGPRNNRTLDQYYLSNMGGLDDADIRFNEESNFYRDGVNPLTSKYGGRTFTFDGYVEASNFRNMRNMQSKLKYSLSAMVEIPFIYRNVWNNGNDLQFSGRKSTPVQMQEQQTTYSARRNFLLTLRSSWPYLESVGGRIDIVTMGATLALPNKGNAPAYPTLTFYGPSYDARLVLGGITVKIAGTLLASSIVNVDCKNRTCSNWALFDPSSDFPNIVPVGGDLSDAFMSFANYASVAGGTAGVSRVEIFWKHAVL